MKPKSAVGMPTPSTPYHPKYQELRVEFKLAYSTPADMRSAKHLKLGLMLKLIFATVVTTVIIFLVLAVVTLQHGQGFWEILKPMFINMLNRVLS
jgi:hypothetical protein